MGATSFPASAIVVGVFDPDRLGTGADGDGLKYLADDNTFKSIDLSGYATESLLYSELGLLPEIYLGIAATTAYTRTLLDDANAAAARTTLGLGSVDNVSAASLRDRSTHTGTQTVSTISDIAANYVGVANTQTISGVKTFSANPVIQRAGQASLAIANTSAGTPTGGASWLVFADNVGGGGGQNTLGFYDVRNVRVAGGFDNSGRFNAPFGLACAQTVIGDATIGLGPHHTAATGRLNISGATAEYSIVSRSVGSFVSAPTAGERFVTYVTSGSYHIWSNTNLLSVNFDGTVTTSGRLVAGGPVLFPGFTFATVPSASANIGATIRITDRSHRIATSNGTVWNWAGTTTAIS